MEPRELNRYADFLRIVASYYAQHGRHDLPWRLSEADGSFDPYKILVSEIMLQQTQVPRVIPKYEAFLRQFPTMRKLADTALGDVLMAWQGLGYNRRAKFLWLAAQQAVGNFSGQLPNSQMALESLPGIGANTAGAIRAYAFNEPVVFIETNIRTVYIHHFFHGQTDVPDSAVWPLVRESLDEWLGKEQERFRQPRNADLFRDRRREKPRGLPRTFYWSLMDYGLFLKQTVGNMSRASRTYAKQSKFAGSARQIRGRALRLLARGGLSEATLLSELHDARAAAILADLVREGLVQSMNGHYKLP